MAEKIEYGVRKCEGGAFHALQGSESQHIAFCAGFFIANWELQNANCKLNKRRKDWAVGAGGDWLAF